MDRLAPVAWRRAVTCLIVVVVHPTAAASTLPSSVGEDGSTHSVSTRYVRSVTHAPRAASNLDVAIVASAASDVTAPWFTDPRDRLLATGRFASVTLINAAAVTPTLNELQAFDAVLVWSNLAFADADLLGDNLADYADGGGGVVVAVFSNSSSTVNRAIGGRWVIDDYEVIPSGSGNTTGGASLGTIDIPGYPLVQGVFSFAGGSSSFRPTTTALAPPSTRIAAWDDGSTLVALRLDKPGFRVDLGFYPPSDAVLPDFWSGSTDGDLLMSNALVFAARGGADLPAVSDWGLICLALLLLAAGSVLSLRRRRAGHQ